jgi:hypothetical protein
MNRSRIAALSLALSMLFIGLTAEAAEQRRHHTTSAFGAFGPVVQFWMRMMTSMMSPWAMMAPQRVSTPKLTVDVGFQAHGALYPMSCVRVGVFDAKGKQRLARSYTGSMGGCPFDLADGRYLVRGFDRAGKVFAEKAIELPHDWHVTLVPPGRDTSAARRQLKSEADVSGRLRVERGKGNAFAEQKQWILRTTALYEDKTLLRAFETANWIHVNKTYKKGAFNVSLPLGGKHLIEVFAADLQRSPKAPETITDPRFPENKRLTYDIRPAPIVELDPAGNGRIVETRQGSGIEVVTSLDKVVDSPNGRFAIIPLDVTVADPRE